MKKQIKTKEMKKQIKTKEMKKKYLSLELNKLYTRYFLLLLLFCFVLQVNAQATYYVANNGNDNNTGLGSGANGALKTISRVNQMISNGTIVSGDTILFKRNNTFYGELIITKPNITISDFGANVNPPILTGERQITGWIQQGSSNIWVHDLGNDFNADLINDLYIDGVSQAYGRWPNYNTSDGGYRKITGSINNNQSRVIIDNTLTSSPNWTGGHVVYRPNAWHVQSRKIKGHYNGTNISFEFEEKDGIQTGYGYFISQHLLTLDINNEWYIDRDARKIYLYHNTNPNNMNISVPQIETLIYSKGNSNISISNLKFAKANNHGIFIEGATANDIVNNIDIFNCDFTQNRTSLYIYRSDDVYVNNCIFSQTNSLAVYFRVVNGCVFTNNTIKDCVLKPQMVEDLHKAAVKFTVTTNVQCLYNTIDNVGAEGIHVSQKAENIEVKYNLISNYVQTVYDYGGVYISGKSTNNSVNIERNIVFDTNPEGHGGKTSEPFYNGLYSDNNTQDVTFKDNTVYNLTNANGLFFQSGTQDINATGNTLIALGLDKYAFYRPPYNPIREGTPNSVGTLSDNIFFSYNTGNNAVVGILPDIASPNLESYTLKNNFYCKPLGTNNKVIFNNNKLQNLDEFRMDNPNQAVNGRYSPVNGFVSKEDNIEFYINKTNQEVLKTLPGNDDWWIDARYVPYKGDINIRPYDSRILMRYENGIIPKYELNGETITSAEISVSAGTNVKLKPSVPGQTGGSWSWTNKNNFSSNTRTPTVTKNNDEIEYYYVTYLYQGTERTIAYKLTLSSGSNTGNSSIITIMNVFENNYGLKNLTSGDQRIVAVDFGTSTPGNAKKFTKKQNGNYFSLQNQLTGNFLACSITSNDVIESNNGNIDESLWQFQSVPNGLNGEVYIDNKWKTINGGNARLILHNNDVLLVSTTNTGAKVQWIGDVFNNSSKNIIDIKSPEEEKTTVNAKVYPNPSNSGYFFVDLNIGDQSGQVELHLIDILGKTIYKKTFYDASNELLKVEPRFEPGVYILKVELNNELIKTSKLIIK